MLDQATQKQTLCGSTVGFGNAFLRPEFSTPDRVKFEAIVRHDEVTRSLWQG